MKPDIFHVHPCNSLWLPKDRHTGSHSISPGYFFRAIKHHDHDGKGKKK